jgi:hypothetical protein
MQTTIYEFTVWWSFFPFIFTWHYLKPDSKYNKHGICVKNKNELTINLLKRKTQPNSSLTKNVAKMSLYKTNNNK